MNQDSIDPQNTAAPKAGPVLTLELGDFLHRIPPGALNDGPHIATQPISFDLNWIDARVQSGDPTVPLSEIYAKAPHIFRDPESAHSAVPVRLPYLKVTRILSQRRAQAVLESPEPTAGPTTVAQTPAAPASEEGNHVAPTATPISAQQSEAASAASPDSVTPVAEVHPEASAVSTAPPDLGGSSDAPLQHKLEELENERRTAT